MGRRALRVGFHLLALLVVGAVLIADPGLAGAESAPGENGECGQRQWSFRNPKRRINNVFVFEPTGDAQATIGGNCDDSTRPTIVFTHGYAAIRPEIYQDLIRHLTSRGHIVVFPNFPVIWWPPWQYAIPDAGFRNAVDRSARIDVDNLGFIGHSFGASMVPRMIGWAADRGWGSESLWAVPMAPHFVNMVGTGPIALPEHMRLLVINFHKDTWVDNRIGIELHHAAALELDHKQHLTVMSGPVGDNAYIQSDHLTPLTIPIVLPADDMDELAIWRPIDALGECAMSGESCDLDFSDVGVSTDEPVDTAIRAFQECEFFINPRPCPTKM